MKCKVVKSVKTLRFVNVFAATDRPSPGHTLSRADFSLLLNSWGHTLLGKMPLDRLWRYHLRRQVQMPGSDAGLRIFRESIIPNLLRRSFLDRLFFDGYLLKETLASIFKLRSSKSRSLLNSIRRSPLSPEKSPVHRVVTKLELIQKVTLVEKKRPIVVSFSKPLNGVRWTKFGHVNLEGPEHQSPLSNSKFKVL